MTRLSVRTLALVAGATLVFAALAPAASGASPPAEPAVPTLSAAPDSDLLDGQAVTVTASGYAAHHSLDLVQCVQDVGCDLSVIQVHDSGDSGGYTATFFVRRIMSLDDGLQVDCAEAQNCILVSVDITEIGAGGAQTSIAFDPDGPVNPPLRFRLTPDPTGRVNVVKGVARVTGTVHCNQPVEISAQMVLTQIYKRHIFQSFQFATIPCTHAERFSVVFRPQNGLFGAGDAKLHLDAFGFTTTNYSISKSATVNLVPSTP